MHIRPTTQDLIKSKLTYIHIYIHFLYIHIEDDSLEPKFSLTDMKAEIKFCGSTGANCDKKKSSDSCFFPYNIPDSLKKKIKKS